MWNIEEAREFLNDIREDVWNSGFHITLGGSTLFAGKGNDLDLCIFQRPIEDKEILRRHNFDVVDILARRDFDIVKTKRFSHFNIIRMINCTTFKSVDLIFLDHPGNSK